MADPTLNGQVWRATKQTSYAATVPASFLDMYIDNANSFAAVRNSSGVNTILTPDKILLYKGGPNDFGAFDIDLSSGEALNCVHIEIFIKIRGNVATTSDNINLFFNTDLTTGNYRYSYTYFDQADATGASAGAAAALIGVITGNTSQTGDYSVGTIFLPHFRNTLYVKQAYSRLNFAVNSATLNDIQFVQRWNTITTAITRVRIRPDGFPADVFQQDSEILVVGHRF